VNFKICIVHAFANSALMDVRSRESAPILFSGGNWRLCREFFPNYDLLKELHRDMLLLRMKLHLTTEMPNEQDLELEN
jgi:hypothetical protein